MKKAVCDFLKRWILPAFISRTVHSQSGIIPASDTIIVQPGAVQDRVSTAWLEALKPRMPADKVDSISRMRKDVNQFEKNWKTLIEIKTSKWNSFRDSLSIPFRSLRLNDTVYILTGYGGYDDGFTYGSRTVCLDLTALQREYGMPSFQKMTPG